MSQDPLPCTPHAHRLRQVQTSVLLSPPTPHSPVRLVVRRIFLTRHDGNCGTGRIKADKGLPKMFERYNGKPTLMTKSSRIVQGPGYFEMDVSILMSTDAIYATC